ncbi:hypothetical protein BSKO_03579 [Bryopsis sp. KO-2023]|nr:hypothetical protein BSKO_03579 [Bryopsis sp. KO-2023]
MRSCAAPTPTIPPRYQRLASRRPCCAVVRCSAAAGDLSEVKLSGKKVLVVGGTGRVGASTASALRQNIENLELCVASRSAESHKDMLERRPELEGTKFVALDFNDRSALEAAMDGMDLVIHAAGPFQRRDSCPVLEAAIQTKTAYLDVCDDTGYAQRAKTFHEQAVSAGIPAITTAGIYPGISNLMAAHIVSTSREEYDENGLHKEAPADALVTERLRYSYYTAGSGGVGPTLIVTSFMLLGEPAVAFKDGERIDADAFSQGTGVDFGPGVGRKNVFLLNLPEVSTAQQVLGIPNVSARFGTSPDVFNWLMWLMARVLPQSLLQDKSFAESMAKFSAPFIEAADKRVGEGVGMRVDLEFDQGKSSSGVFVHPKMSESIGFCVGAFARCMLAGGTQPGVWFPEEKQAVSHRRSVFKMASEGCIRLVLNKSSWAIESPPTQLGMGFYIY